jgi:hypothetical protein
MRLFVLILLAMPSIVWGQVKKAPEIKEGDGPYSQLIIRGVILVDGTGAPPVGPVDIVVRNNKIAKIQTVGYPGVAINQDGRSWSPTERN